MEFMRYELKSETISIGYFVVLIKKLLLSSFMESRRRVRRHRRKKSEGLKLLKRSILEVKRKENKI